jgi:hypothetical protein
MVMLVKQYRKGTLNTVVQKLLNDTFLGLLSLFESDNNKTKINENFKVWGSVAFLRHSGQMAG